MAVSRQMVLNAITDDVRQHFTEIVKSLAGIPEREDRITFFTSAQQSMTDAHKHVVRLLTQKETLHIRHVTACLNEMDQFPKDRKSHDYSKDGLYFFVTSCKFDVMINSDNMAQLLQAECNRHFELEAHHPEFESINNKECQADDIVEMAVDRMSRNVQANDGVVILEEMQKYLPKFPLGDNEAKQKVYTASVLKYKPLVEAVYTRVFSEMEAAKRST